MKATFPEILISLAGGSESPAEQLVTCRGGRGVGRRAALSGPGGCGCWGEAGSLTLFCLSKNVPSLRPVTGA